MGLSIPNVSFELNQVYKIYSEQLQLASNISGFLLDSANIDSAGQQVEASLRILLKALLPGKVSVSHGHIVDKYSKVSNQQDFLITESFHTKSLIKTLDGTEFYPYEAIFACGEVKRTWSQNKLESAIKSITRIKQELNRSEISANQITSSTGFQIPDKITSNPCRNTLFACTFSIDFDKTYDERKIAAIYKTEENKKHLPNISVILNRGIIVCVDSDKLNKGEISIKLYPEHIASEEKYKWVRLALKPEENLAYLIFMLTQHINDTILEKISAMEYAQSMINIPRTNIFPL